MALSVVDQTNQQIMSGIANIPWMSVLGWIVFFAILIGGGFFAYIAWNNKKIFNKKVTAFEIVGINYVPSIRDAAKVVKLGSGGFEILYLQKQKIFRISYGGRVGKSDYYFFINHDGYWYNGMLSANIYAIDKLGGLIPIVTTNPNMRAQYTSLEKQIDSMHAEKKTFMDKYGMWVVGGGFFLGLGIVAWLIFQQVAPILSQIGVIQDKLATVVDKIAQLLTRAGEATVAPAASSGLVPA